jgi:hypothetical protein
MLDAGCNGPEGPAPRLNPANWQVRYAKFNGAGKANALCAGSQVKPDAFQYRTALGSDFKLFYAVTF